MIPFGKKIKVMNFFVLKYTKALSSGELKRMRNAQGIPAEAQKHLQRGGLPYIKVMTLSENWSVEFVCCTAMYELIERFCVFEDSEHGELVLTEEALAGLHNLFVLMYSDTAIVGDTEYFEAKGKALNEFMARQWAKKETPDSKAEDDAVLEELKKDEEAKAAIFEMANEVAEAQQQAQREETKEGKEGGDGSN